MVQDSQTNFRTLDPQKIVDTIERLTHRVEERFPNAGLADACTRLHDISENMKKRAEWIGRPVYWLRGITWLIGVRIVLIAIVPAYYLAKPAAPLGLEPVEGGLAGFVTVLEAGLNDIVLIGAAIFFFLTLETRYKRQRALKAIHELRTVAHIIDMHQLTKNPHRLSQRMIYSPTGFSPRLQMTPFQLRRYLEYCSEMLALTGKIAAVYVQEFDDGVALASASELETLTAGLSNKIWQKISILETASAGEDPPGIQTV